MGGAVVRTGYAGKYFCWLYDRRTGEALVEEESLLVPGAVSVDDCGGVGGSARMRGLTSQLTFRRGARRATLEARLGSLTLALRFETWAQPAMTAIAPVNGAAPRGTNLTQKRCGIPAAGVICWGKDRRHELQSGAVGALDLSHGLLARRTTWRWACGGRVDAVGGGGAGFNLVEGFNQGLENVYWVGGELRSVGQVRIEYEEEAPERPWRVRSADGAVELEMEVEAVRRDDTDLRPLVRSRYLQPLGRWSGRVGELEVDEAFGVAEDHLAVW